MNYKTVAIIKTLQYEGRSEADVARILKSIGIPDSEITHYMLRRIRDGKAYADVIPFHLWPEALALNEASSQNI